jgi:hypothetical protein
LKRQLKYGKVNECQGSNPIATRFFKSKVCLQ